MTIQFASKRQWYNIQLSLCGARGLEDFSIDFVLHVHMSMIHARNTLCANPSTRFWPSRRERQNSYHCRNIYLNDNTSGFMERLNSKRSIWWETIPMNCQQGKKLAATSGSTTSPGRIKRCLIFLSFHVTPTARFSHNERSRLKSDSLHSSILSH
jgi:hypothetical protein